MAETRARRVAFAIIHGDPPVVILGEDEQIVNEKIALEVVAESDPGTSPPPKPSRRFELLCFVRIGPPLSRSGFGSPMLASTSFPTKQ